MLLQRSKLAAAIVERPRLAPPWSITLLGVLVLAVLVAIYPHRALVNRILEAPQDEVTEAYLVNLMRTDPNNPRLGLLLVRHQLNSNLYDKVDETLARLRKAPDEATRLEALWLGWLVEDKRFRFLNLEASERVAMRNGLRDRLRALADHKWPEEMLIEIVRQAILFGDTALGLTLLDRLAESNEGRSAFWYSDAARTALAHGEYRAAGQFFLIAAQRAPTPAESRRYFVDAMLALQSGNLVREALVEAEEALARHPALGDSPQVLELLVRFARAVRRPDLADKYARKLLRLSLQLQWQREQLAQTYGIRRMQVNESGGPKLPFDDRIYTLGFEAFLDNRKLEDAWQVAAAAVRQAPENLAWRERLARVSEWTGRPSIALTHWLHVARANGSDEAWQAVLRLAPGLFDDEALRPALEYQLRRQPANEALVGELIATYERLGNPKGAMALLEQIHAQRRQPELLTRMAELAERMGDDDKAIALWQRFMAGDRLTAAQSVHVATLQLMRGEPAVALTTLESVDDAADTSAAYWRLRGDIAAQLGQDEKAATSYRRVLADTESVARDHENLARLLLDEYPLEAARVSGDGWLRFRDQRLLLQALGLYATAGGWQETGRLMRTLTSEETAQLRQQAAFLRLSAQYRIAIGQRSQALADLDAAFALAPDSPDTQQALLWLLIESGEGERLRNIMAARERDWQPDPAMHDALAAAYLGLSLPDIALRRYLTPRLAAHQGDFLWLMNYADALEQNQEIDRAWRLRKQLLLDEKQQMRRQSAAERLPREMAALRQAARARLLMLDKPGDPAYATLRELLRLDRRENAQLSPAARDAAFGWLLEAEQYDAARGWLWQQYAKTAARPLWGEMRLALESGDRARSGQLLDDYAPLIPRNDRIEAARLTGDLRLAQSEAFDAQIELPADDPLHLQLSEALLAHSHHAGGSVWQSKIGKVDERNTNVRTHIAISPRLSLDFELGKIGRDNKDRTAIGVTPDETYRLARLNWQHDDGRTRVTFAERDSFERYHPLLIEHEQNLDKRLSTSFALGLDQPANDSTALRVAGMKDIASMSFTYRPTRLDRISIERRYENLHAQTGTELGSGHIWQVEYGHALRSEPRSLEASVFWSHHRYSRRSNINDPRLRPLLPTDADDAADIGADFFVPNGYIFKGIRLSTDMNFEEDYTRAWRPYASVARTWHSTEGPGYDLAAGIAGSVYGADHLGIGWRMSSGGTRSDGLVREFGLNYRLHF